MKFYGKLKYVIFFVALGVVFAFFFGCPTETDDTSEPELSWDIIGVDPPLDPTLDVGSYYLDSETGQNDEAAMAARYRERYGNWANTETPGGSKVYFTSDISEAGLKAVYSSLGVNLPSSAKVAVKINMGEQHNNNYLSPQLIKGLVNDLNGTLVDSTTYYDQQLASLGLPDIMAGIRRTPAGYRQVAEAHGFTAIGAPIDILNDDPTPEINVPITDGKHLSVARLGSHIMNYDWIVSIAHFKGHGNAGYGGTFKNLAIGIGIASWRGKREIHTNDPVNDFFFTTEFEPFQEKIIEYNQALMQNTKFKDHIVYINVLNKLSRDCDCINGAEAPALKDIGILASLDPVALEKASVDMIYKAAEDTSDPTNAAAAKHLVTRIEAMRGNHQIRHAARLQLGHLKYELVEL
jgi:uncharacterized Fe-S center protein